MDSIPTDEEILFLERQRSRRWRVLQISGVALLASLMLIEYAPMPAELRLSVFHFALPLFGAFALGMLVYRLVFLGSPNPKAQTAHLLRRQVDDYQSRTRWQWASLLLILLSCAASQDRLIAGIDAGIASGRLPVDYLLSHADYVLLGLVASVFLMGALSFALPVVWLKRKLDRVIQDELSSELRTKALKIGYVAAISALLAAFTTLSVTKVDPLRLLIWLTLAATAAPIITFLILDWRAGRSA